jgi:phospholipid transport system substrate-binding protein
MVFKNYKVIITYALFMLVVFMGPTKANHHLSKSSDFVQSLADRAVTALTTDGITMDTRRRQFRDVIRQSFAIDSIARFALGRYWRRATEENRIEYLKLFEDLIVITWADQFSTYAGENLKVQESLDAASSQNKVEVAIVRSIWSIDRQTKIHVDWRVASQGNIYKVTDVMIEGISIARTKRDEFASVIRRNNNEISALLKVLREKKLNNR